MLKKSNDDVENWVFIKSGESIHLKIPTKMYFF